MRGKSGETRPTIHSGGVGVATCAVEDALESGAEGRYCVGGRSSAASQFKESLIQ